MGPQAAICRFTSGFTFQPQMRYPVLVQISAHLSCFHQGSFMEEILQCKTRRWVSIYWYALGKGIKRKKVKISFSSFLKAKYLPDFLPNSISFQNSFQMLKYPFGRKFPSKWKRWSVAVDILQYVLPIYIFIK